MLQAAFGGYAVIQDTTTSSDLVEFSNDAPNAWFEPGFNILFPLDFSVTESDIVTILLRRRRDIDGTAFSTTLDAEDLEVTVNDATTGKVVASTAYVVSSSSVWYEEDFNVVAVDIIPKVPEDDPDQKVRLMDVYIKDSFYANLNDFIKLQLKVDFNDLGFAFLPVENDRVSERPKVSSFGTQGIIVLRDTGTKVLLSPVASFEESTADDSDFSYPIKQIYYRLDDQPNSEPYDFSLTLSSDLANGYAHLVSVADSKGVAVLILDGQLKSQLGDLTTAPYVDVKAIGKISGKEDNFRLYLARREAFAKI
jgi:hypothetical protein